MIRTDDPDGRLPYHRAGRPGHRLWWPAVGSVVLVATALAAVILLVLGSIAAAALAGVGTAPAGGDALLDDPVWDLAVSFLLIACLLPAVAVAVRVERRRLGSVSSVAGRLRWRWLGRCALLAVPLVAVGLGVYLALTLVVDRDLDGGGGTATAEVGAARLAATVAVVLVVVPLQCAGEEYLARGWIPQAVGARLRSPWPGALVGAAVFAALHGPTTWAGTADLVVFALVLSWLTQRTGGLEAALAWHTATNVIVTVLAAAAGELEAGMPEGNAGGAEWPLLVSDLLVLPLFALLVVRTHRRLGLAAAFPVPTVPPDPPWPTVPVVDRSDLALPAGASWPGLRDRPARSGSGADGGGIGAPRVPGGGDPPQRASSPSAHQR